MKILYTSTFILIYATVFGQNWKWANRAEGVNMDIGTDLHTSYNGDNIVTGYFTDTVNFDTIQLISIGQTDIFIAQYNSNGGLNWAKQSVSLTGTAYAIANNVCVDINGNISLSYHKNYFTFFEIIDR